MTAIAATDLAQATVAQLAVRALDVDRATAFYRDQLGLPFLFAYPGLAFFQSGQVRLMLSKAESGDFDHPTTGVYFKVEGLDAVHATLESRGVAFIDKPHLIHRAATYELWMAFFKDSEGNTLALMEERPLAAG
jgi:methylmalonyl-CoA/ethylmalonyl-CoA epimerase